MYVYVTSSQSSVFAQNSKDPWPPVEGERKEGKHQNKKQGKKEKNYKLSKWSAIQHETHDSLLLQHAFVRLGCGNTEFGWGCWGNDEGLGGGSITYQSIWLGAPGLTDLSLGWWNQSTSTDVSTQWDQQALPDPTPPPLFPLSTQPMCRSKELSPALITVQLLFKHCKAITYECSNSSVQVIAI